MDAFPVLSSTKTFPGVPSYVVVAPPPRFLTATPNLVHFQGRRLFHVFVSVASMFPCQLLLSVVVSMPSPLRNARDAFSFLVAFSHPPESPNHIFLVTV